jgi:hypothetical protein
MMPPIPWFQFVRDKLHTLEVKSYGDLRMAVFQHDVIWPNRPALPIVQAAYSGALLPPHAPNIFPSWFSDFNLVSSCSKVREWAGFSWFWSPSSLWPSLAVAPLGTRLRHKLTSPDQTNLALLPSTLKDDFWTCCWNLHLRLWDSSIWHE